MVLCSECGRVLPEIDYIAEDNSDVSVGCDCKCMCDKWYCWACMCYDKEAAAADEEWHYPTCLAKCPKEDFEEDDKQDESMDIRDSFVQIDSLEDL